MLGDMLSFQDVRRNQIRSHPKLLCWFDAAPKIWTVLVTGWLWLLTSTALSFQIPSSGAVLVCAAVLGELLFEKLPYRNWPRMEGGQILGFALIEDSVGHLALTDGGRIFIGKTDGFGGPIRALLGLSRNSEWNEYGHINGKYQKGTIWLCGRTVERVETVISTAIITTAVIGTLVWGYSHCLFQNCDGPI